MANTYMKRRSTVLVKKTNKQKKTLLVNTEIKITMRHHYTLCEWPKCKIMTTLSTDNIVLGGLNPRTLLMGMKNGTTTSEPVW